MPCGSSHAVHSQQRERLIWPSAAASHRTNERPGVWVGLRKANVYQCQGQCNESLLGEVSCAHSGCHRRSLPCLPNCAGKERHQPSRGTVRARRLPGDRAGCNLTEWEMKTWRGQQNTWASGESLEVLTYVCVVVVAVGCKKHLSCFLHAAQKEGDTGLQEKGTNMSHLGHPRNKEQAQMCPTSGGYLQVASKGIPLWQLGTFWLAECLSHPRAQEEPDLPSFLGSSWQSVTGCGLSQSLEGGHHLKGFAEGRMLPQ